VLITHGAGTSTTLLIVLHNQSTPGNISFNRIDVTNPSAATTATIADLDGDGKPEIITTSEAGNRFSIFKNLHTAGALSAASFGTPFNTTVTAPRGIIAGDLNLDGKPEIIVTRAAGFLLVYENLVPTVTITITQQPQNSAVCENQTTTFSTDATGTTNILYQWQIGATSAGPFTPINNGGGYSNANTKTLSVNTTGNFGAGFYRCRITGDLASMVFTNPAELVITPIPAAPGVTPGSSCGAGNVLLTASGGTNGNYRWYTVPAGGQAIGGEVNSAYTTPSLAATTTYYVSLVNGICEGARTAVIATIVTIPQKTIITASTPLVNNALTICSTSSLTLSAPAGFNSYLWSTGATTSQITVSATGNYSVTVTASGCTSPASDIASITVVTAPCTNQAPAINTTALSTTIGGSVSTDVLALISDDDNNIVPSSLTIVQQPQSGATVTLVNGMMTIDYQNNPFVGTDVVTLQVCDVFGECAQRQFSIDVIGDIEVFNGISANNDLQNDKFIIEHIEKLDDTRANQVTIYNRWGNVVFEMTDYNNDDRVFTGYNKSGNELPSGTYYYKIQFASGRKSESGYLVIKR